MATSNPFRFSTKFQDDATGLVYYGYWFSPEREMLQKAIDASQQSVSGRVRLKLYKGSVTVAGRKSACSLYDPRIATFEEGEEYHQADADGFIKLNALRLKLRRLKQAKGSRLR